MQIKISKEKRLPNEKETIRIINEIKKCLNYEDLLTLQDIIKVFRFVGAIKTNFHFSIYKKDKEPLNIEQDFIPNKIIDLI